MRENNIPQSMFVVLKTKGRCECIGNIGNFAFVVKTDEPDNVFYGIARNTFLPNRVRCIVRSRFYLGNNNIDLFAVSSDQTRVICDVQWSALSAE